MQNSKLRLWDRVIFVDWSGVLSNAPFWSSILTSDSHPLRDELTRETQLLFRDSDRIEQWMRGFTSSSEVLRDLTVVLDRRFGEGYLSRRLHQDCRVMSVDGGALQLLSEFFARAFMVIATDNMDCFYEEVTRARSGRNTRGKQRLILKDVARGFDGVICSSDVGTLKSQRPDIFFGDWLRRHGLGFSQALLLDDSEVNCRAFEQAGGSAIHILPSDSMAGFQRLRPFIAQWFDRSQPNLQVTER